MQFLCAVSKMTGWSLFISRQIIQYPSNPSLCPNLYCQRWWSWTNLWRSKRPSRTNTKKDVIFILGVWNAKVGSQEILGVTRKFDLGVQNEAGQRLTKFCQENTLVIENTLFRQHKKDSTHGHHQRVNIKIRLIILFAAMLEMLYTVSKNKIESWLWLRSWTPYSKIQT